MSAGNGSSFVLKVRELYPSGLFSDLTIKCGGESFKVHKNILYLQSEYFQKALDGAFKEANTSTLDLPDDPAVMKVLLHYFYNFTLDDSHRPANTSLSPFIVSVYAIADKYDVPQLRVMATQRFRNVCDPVRDYEDFLAAIKTVDESTGEPTLYNVILPKVRDNIPLLMTKESFRDLIMDLPNFTFQLVTFMGSGEVVNTSWQPDLDAVNQSANAENNDDDDDDNDDVDAGNRTYGNPRRFPPPHRRGTAGYQGPGRRLG